MFRIIQKALMVSFFLCLPVLSMRPMVSAVLKNVSARELFARVALTEVLARKGMLQKTPVRRCPIITAAMLSRAVEDTIQETVFESLAAQDTIDVVSKNESTAVTHHRDTASNTRTASGVQPFQPFNQHVPSYTIHLHHDQTASSPDWQHKSPIDAAQNRNTREQQQYVAAAIAKYQLEAEMAKDFEGAKKNVASCFDNFPALVQQKALALSSSRRLLSPQAIAAEKVDLQQQLWKLEKELLQLTNQHYEFKLMSENSHLGCADESISHRCPDNWTRKDYYIAQEILELKIKIEAIKVAIQECDWTMYRIEQEKRDFVYSLQHDSIDTLEQNTIPSLMKKKDDVASLVAQCENTLRQQAQRQGELAAQLAVFNKRSAWTKVKNVFKPNHTGAALVSAQKSILAEQHKTQHTLQSVSDELKKYSEQIEQAQQAVHEKKQQIAKPMQQQAQDRAGAYQRMIERQHNLCSYDMADCPGHEVEVLWGQRKEAQSQTVEQNYAQYDKKYYVTPQVKAFLTKYSININDLEHCLGTVLQQQLHGEVCDNLARAAAEQLLHPYQENVLTSVVNVASAALEANKSNNVRLASQLLDVNCYLFKLHGEMVDIVMPYAQAGICGVIDFVKETLHVAAHPIQTIEGLGKAIYYVIETAILNDPELVIKYPDTYETMRDARNAEIIAALKDLGEQLANSSGPERFGALVKLGANFVIPEKILHTVGEICGLAKGKSRAVLALEGATCMAEERGLAQEMVRAADNLHKTAQEKITKALSTQLLDAETNIAKSKVAKYNADTELMSRLQQSQGKISKKNEVLRDTASNHYEHIESRLNIEFDPSLLEKSAKTMQTPSGQKISVCIDLEHIMKFEYELGLDRSETYYQPKLKGGHLAGTMDKLIEAKLVELVDATEGVEPIVEFSNGCKQYKAVDLITGRQFTHTEFPPHWDAKK